MKFLLLIVLIVSCGKKSTQEEYYQADQTTLSQDADADGIQDWDEIHAGKDPFVSNVQETFPEISKEVTLVQNDGLEVVIQPQVKRVLRELLLKKSLEANKALPLPEVSQLELRFQNRPAYWRTKLAGKHFTKILSIAGKSLKLDDGFINEPSLKLNANLSSGIIEDLTERTYRFIVSTPEGEKIYRVSPKLSIFEFMTQQNLFPVGLELDEFNRESYGWRLVNLSKDFHNTAVAGKTYAIVYGSNLDFREQEINKTKLSLLNEAPSSFSFSHKLNITVFMTHGQIAVTKDKVKRFELSPNPEMSALCSYTTRTLIKREKQDLPSIEIAMGLINWDSIQFVKLDWFEPGQHGVAFNLTIQILEDEWNPQFKSGLLSSIIETGVVQSGCGRTVPVKKQIIPRITGLEGYLLLEASL